MLCGINSAVDLVVGPVLPVLRSWFAAGTAKLIAGIRVELRTKGFFIIIIGLCKQTDEHKQTCQAEKEFLHIVCVFEGRKIM